MRVYLDHFVKNSPFIQRADRVPRCVPTGQEIMISNAELFKTEYYNDFMRPRRMGHYSNGIVFERSNFGMTALSIADHSDDRNRRSHQVWLLGVLLPHLRRAIQLHRVISAERATAMAIRTVFDRWAHAAFVLDETGRMVSMNAAAIALRRPAPASPLYAMTWPLPFDGSPELGGGRGRVLVIIFDPQQAGRTPVGWLAQRYRLSPAETKLTEAIVNGARLRTPPNSSASSSRPRARG